MLSLRKNKGLVVVMILAVLSVSLLAFQAKAQPSSIFFDTTALATTTVNFVSAGATDGTNYTYQFDSPSFSSGKIANVSTIDATSLYLQAAASSSASVITITPQYSNNNVDWYSLGSQGTASALGVVTVASSTILSWQPGTTATTSMVLNLPAVPALHERVTFGTSVGSSSIYAEVDLKQNPSNP